MAARGPSRETDLWNGGPFTFHTLSIFGRALNIPSLFVLVRMQLGAVLTFVFVLLVNECTERAQQIRLFPQSHGYHGADCQLRSTFIRQTQWDCTRSDSVTDMLGGALITSTTIKDIFLEQ